MQSWEGIKSLTLSSGIGKAKSTHTNTWWKYSRADTYKTDAIITRGACLCAGLNRRDIRAAPTGSCNTHGICRAAGSPPSAGAPALPPTWGPPSSHQPGTARGRAARGVAADHPRHPQQSPAAGWPSALLNPGLKRARKKSGHLRLAGCLSATAPGQ